jgi:hypothetical protein
MQPFGRMVPLTEVSPACWFLFPGDNGKRLCMRIRPSPTEVTQDLGYVELARFSPSRSLEPRLCISRDAADAAVFALSDVQVQVPADLSSVYPDGRRKDTKARWKPGALIVAGEEYRLIVVDPHDEIAMVSLADGSFYRDGEQREMAVSPVGASCITSRAIRENFAPFLFSAAGRGLFFSSRHSFFYPNCVWLQLRSYGYWSLDGRQCAALRF